MATTRPFEYGKKDYIDRLNDLYNSGIPKVRTSALDPDAPGTDVTASRQMRLGDNGCCADCKAGGITISFHSECLIDGFSVCINAVSGGTVTVDPAALPGVKFMDGTTTKAITVGNAAIISSDGVAFRIFRMTAT